MKQQYLRMLALSIRRRRFDPGRETIDLNDETTVAIIKSTLQQSDTFQVLHALSLVQEVPRVDWLPALLPLVEHESPVVRRQTLHLLQSLGDKQHGDVIYRRLSDPDGEVRGAAIQTYCAIYRDDALKDIALDLSDPEPVVRGAAVMAVIQYCSPDAAQQAAYIVKSMVADPDPVMRAAAADALGGLHDPSLVELLVKLTADDDLDVQAHALRAAGRLQHPELLPMIANRLGDPRAAALATQALLAYGAGMVTALDAVFTNAQSAIAVRRLIPKVLGRCPSRDSALILLKHLEEPDDLTRARIYKALVRLQANQVPIPREKQGEVSVRLMAELRIGYELAVLRADLGSTEVLLADALAWRQLYSTDRIFYLLGVLHPDTNMAQIRAALNDSDTRRRANAIELLDTFVARPVKALLLPLLEGSEARIRQAAVEHMDLRSMPARAWVAHLAQGPIPGWQPVRCIVSGSMAGSTMPRSCRPCWTWMIRCSGRRVYAPSAGCYQRRHSERWYERTAERKRAPGCTLAPTAGTVNL
jgi:HEAT repeat protein